MLVTDTGVLLGFSLFTREVDLPLGAKMYFCEVDCYLSDFILPAWTPAKQVEPITSNGQFVVVESRTWFDPSTISPVRRNGSLTPNDRVAILTDGKGHAFGVSEHGEQVLAGENLRSTPLRTLLRPCEAYTSYLAFEVPSGWA